MNRPPSAATPRLLCIDDDPLQHRVIEGMVRAFRHTRYQCDHALSFDEGLARLVNGEYAACLLDYQLDRRDGLVLLREAHRVNPETPVIMITSSDTEEVDIAASEFGAVDFLVKSELSPRVLERAVRYAVKLGGTLAQLRALALRDELTGLLNRREMQTLLHDEWLRTSRFLRPFSLGLADIDHFKLVNDEHGHPVGDKVIRHVAQVLQGRLRRVDRVARLGGEEFAILLPETARAEAIVAMERLRASVEQSPCLIPELHLRIPVTISIGLAVSLEDADGPDALIAAADKRLYAAKHAGRNQLSSQG
jgi:two-component system, cell cycle response regulator